MSLSFPAAPSQSPGSPVSPYPLVFEQFKGINTKPPRVGIQDDQMYWCDGWMPIGPNNLRTLYGLSSAVFTASSVSAGSLINWFAFGNIDATPYGVVLLSDGSIWAFQSLGLPSQIMPASTIQSPGNGVGFSQWGSKYLLFCSSQLNGYWIWDGTNLFLSGTIAPEIAVTNAGMNYTSPPTIVASGGSGSGATFQAVLQNGAVERIIVTGPGSGWLVNDNVILTITGGGSDDMASATATVTQTGGIEAIVVADPGAGAFGSHSAVALSGGNPIIPGKATLSLVDAANGSILSITVTYPGKGYTSAPNVSIANNQSQYGFVAFAVVTRGEIASVAVNHGGSGYTTPPDVTVLGDGTGAVLSAIIGNGQVTEVVVTKGGSGYTYALIQFSGGNNGASATGILMPFGVSGTSMETYENRVWVTNGGPQVQPAPPPRARTIFSAPQSPCDFGDGGGAFLGTDSFLRVGYQSLKQTNGFLYLVGDSSLNYISNPQTSGTPAVTTFSNLNVDPQIGSPWPGTVQVFSRNVVFANSIGVYVSYGGQVTPVSQALDGIYSTVPLSQFGIQPTAAVAEIFSIPVYILLLPIIDPITGQKINKLLMFDGKIWWSSNQEQPLTYIATQEINSNLNAFGTDGLSIYQLFAQPSSTLVKTVQSKLWAAPSYIYTKQAPRIWGMVNYYQPSITGDLNVTVDSDDSESATISAASPGGLIWYDNPTDNDPMTWYEAP